jgi:pimeloyl-ACP methyl ester carboxylesterase
MEKFERDGAVLEYSTSGVGDPVLLIPLSRQPVLAGSYRIITYHRRGYGRSTVGGSPVTMADQAADAAALLGHLTVPQAHVVGHSYGGLVALQLAVDRPDLVRSLALLEPPLMAVPSAAALRDEVLLPALARYRSGDRHGALDLFLTEVFGPDWQAAVEAAVPGGVSDAQASVDTFFTIDLPTARSWTAGEELAGTVSCPVLSVVGSHSPLFRVEGRQLLHRWLPQTEDFDLPAANHLLQMQNPADLAAALHGFFERGTDL